MDARESVQPAGGRTHEPSSRVAVGEKAAEVLSVQPAKRHVDALWRDACDQ